MKKSLLGILTFVSMVFLSAGLSAIEIPNPVRGQFYPVYYEWMDPTVTQVPLDKVNATFIAFAHTMPGDGVQLPPSVSPNASPYAAIDPSTYTTDKNAFVLCYENARGVWNGKRVPPATGDTDHDRILKIASEAHKTPGNKVLISLGWNQQDWQNISTDLNSGNPHFVSSVVQFMEDNDLDGFDIDYEGVNGISETDFTTICQQLKSAFAGKYILSLTPYQTSMLNQINMACFDMVNFQTYVSPDQYSSFYNQFTTSFNVPANKMSFGTCEDTPDSHDFLGAVTFATSNSAAGVFNWQIQDDQTEKTHKYKTPSGGNVTYNSFPSVNYFYDYMK
ncbi:MAG: glycosyl hydrolase family 18 protein [Lentisphaerota bacterium]